MFGYRIDTENLIMDYDYFIENVPAKYYGAAYLNYFTLENGGIINKNL